METSLDDVEKGNRNTVDVIDVIDVVKTYLD